MTSPAVPPGTARRMADHFQDSVRIKNAVIAGELQDVREPARRIRESSGSHPEPWRPFLQANEEFAAIALAASDLPAAAQSAADLARTCGECHAAFDAGPDFAPPGIAPVAPPHATKEHMLRHQWAADRMWEALISRNDAAWQAGAAALADTSLDKEDLNADVELPDDLLGLNEHVIQLGARARTTPEWRARARIYGDFLASCAACHQGGC